MGLKNVLLKLREWQESSLSCHEPIDQDVLKEVIGLLDKMERIPWPPAVVVIDIRTDAVLDPRWEWVNITGLGDRPYDRRFCRGRQLC